MKENEETERLLKQLIQIANELKIEMNNIRKSLDKIDNTIQEGFWIDWDDEEVENYDPH
tara:strand:+ start:1331 stop:1507 length:177 start_codon:yes stop_codon:yes gene_type:complete